MTPWLRRMRRAALTPDTRDVLMEVRGFPIGSPSAQASLETAGRAFLEGFGLAAEHPTSAEAATALRDIEGNRRGFAFEGAAMALAIRDALPIGHRHHVSDFIAVSEEHVYMLYVGVGWALARLPRQLHRAATVGLTDPVLVWLALDGYGFHQAYFRTSKYVDDHYVDTDPPQLSIATGDYARNAIDQGIGRALWFVSGADPDRACTLIDGFAPHRRADLFAGLGLAATYAGGATESELTGLARRAAEHRLCLAQGAVFAAEARRRAGITQPATTKAVRILTGHSVIHAADVAVDTRPTEPIVDGQVAYAVWRDRIRHRCASAELESGNSSKTATAQVES
ncbi:DUF1702 family protein [Nocardia sp. CS682]|uniref:DUF1702 family protein n=1 Tax=Nocardia sp. CS682 TaxID=1047172 RepID=UPI0010751928|nr:DUF1702 family protein [Nocardia sp. CS682]QBS44883.1 enediyne biosynthesis protein [Nocardia sp. CS682]